MRASFPRTALLLLLVAEPATASRESRLVPAEMKASFYTGGAAGVLFTNEVTLRNLSPFPQTVKASIEDESIGLSILVPSGSPGGGWVISTAHPPWYNLVTPVPTAFRTTSVVEKVLPPSGPGAGFTRLVFSVCCGWKPSGAVCQPYDETPCPTTTVDLGDVRGAQSSYRVGRIVLTVSEDRGGVVASASLKATTLGDLSAQNAQSDDFLLLFNGGRPF